MISRFDIEKIVYGYLAAFSKSNPNRPLPSIRYERGWFYFIGELGATTKYRRAAILRMTKNLQDRILESA